MVAIPTMAGQESTHHQRTNAADRNATPIPGAGGQSRSAQLPPNGSAEFRASTVQQEMKTFWTTFYSYKGGVGRSLALSNVAALLVRDGHRVVLLDFDLEAPGLDTFSEFTEAKGQAGIVEYVAQFQRLQVAPDIRKFVHPITLPIPLRGALWIMPAGRKDSAYNNLLAQTRWAELYDRGLGAPFIENWKLSIEQAYHPDYVLIDSRTGLTEVGGVCTTAFPDMVVMLLGLNEQNVEGTATVARHIRNVELERPPQLHFVVTPLPN